MPEDTTVSRLGVVNDVAEVTKPAPKKGAVEKNANMTPGDDGLLGVVIWLIWQS